MKRPANIIDTKEYREPYTFENDREAILFYAYLELEKYVDFLEGNGFNCWDRDCGLPSCSTQCDICAKTKTVKK